MLMFRCYLTRRAGDQQWCAATIHVPTCFHLSQNPFYIATSKGPGPTALLLRELLGIDLPPDSPRLMTSLIPPEARKAEALRRDHRRHQPPTEHKGGLCWGLRALMLHLPACRQGPSLGLQGSETPRVAAPLRGTTQAAVPVIAGIVVGVSNSMVARCRSVAERPMIAEGGAKLHFVDDRFETVEAIAADPHLSALPKFQIYFATWCAAARVPCIRFGLLMYPSV